MKPFFKKSYILLLIAAIITIFSVNYSSKVFVNKSNADMSNKNTENSTTTTTKGLTKADLVFDEELNSNIVLIGDLKTGHIVHSKNMETRTSIASITKWMSAVVFLENDELEGDLIIDENIYSQLPHKNDLLLNERISKQDLLKMALIMSSNDAIVALANSINYQEFIQHMNDKAFELGMYQTKFDNPIGFDSTNNYSTAADLFQLAKYIYNNHQTIGDISKEKSYSFHSKSNIFHLIIPTNSVLDKLQNFWGGKTGFTDEANEALLSIFEINDNGTNHAFVSIVIQSSSRFHDTLKISEWISKNKSLLIK